MSNTHLHFNVGEEVAEFNEYGRFVGFIKILKVYRSGNLILRPGGQQFRQTGSTAGNAWRGGHIETLTTKKREKLQAVLDQYNHNKQARNIIKNLGEINTFNQDDVDQLKAVLGRLRND